MISKIKLRIEKVSPPSRLLMKSKMKLTLFIRSSQMKMEAGNEIVIGKIFPSKIEIDNGKVFLRKFSDWCMESTQVRLVSGCMERA